ncbi:hypothetical protein GJ496_005902 [Pomphorhynchus laevis]|nr:hypothetical protein GJ496_005902 [Pomphorhynchus laevis]
MVIWWILQNKFNELREIGPRYGYHINAAKCKIYANGNYIVEIRREFDNTDLTVVESGLKAMGVLIDGDQFIEQYIRSFVFSCSLDLDRLATTCNSDIQTACIAFI